MEEPIVMYIVVRKLGMSLDTTCAQVGHAVGQLYAQYYHLEAMEEGGYVLSDEEAETSDLFSIWEYGDYRKVVLSADEKDWEKLKALANKKTTIVDNGLTELEPNTETVIGFMPMRKSMQPKEIKRLQVLK